MTEKKHLIYLNLVYVPFNIIYHNFDWLSSGIIFFLAYEHQSKTTMSILLSSGHLVYHSEPSGLLIYTRNSKLHDNIKGTAMRSFRKLKEPYLTF